MRTPQTIALLLAMACLPTPSLAATSKAATLRDQAQALCYDDVMRLCNDAVPDEDRITACMKVKRKQLSPPCGKVFDEGITQAQ